ncbi:GNAT family N-acetyltransferase [uncultured Erythrobacter sp.]|uniref:GNAT family N-acetyltransferase n=1 Tax=uncultured Erythrobacter sp. TaxID=263913 RepID=UPI00344D25D5
MTCPRLIDRIMQVMETAFDPNFGEAWNRRQIGDALSMPSTHALIVDADGQTVEKSECDPAGFVLTRAAPGEEELLLIAVVPQHRGKGLAQTLIDQLFAAARSRGATRIYLEMRRGNPAIHLYEKVGFEPIGVRPNYYRMASGEKIDAITFGRTI